MNAEQPLISVVTVNYNNCTGLHRTISSVCAQMDRKNIEHIVIDGKSDDGSVEYLLSRRDSIDHCLIEEDSGIFDAMNKGIRAANGDLIYFLNSGDVFASERSVCSVSSILDSILPDVLGVSGRVKLFRNGFFVGFAHSEPWPCHQSIFLKTQIMKEYMFDTNLKVFGDLDLWRRIKFERGLNFHTVDEVFAEMELDGVGTNPIYFMKRGKDKLKLVNNVRDFALFLLSFIWEVIGYFIFTVFGSRFYYSRFIGIKNFIRKKIRNVFRLFDN